MILTHYPQNDGPCYPGNVDPLIYNDHTATFTPAQWMSLALAAADQAGLKKTDQNTIRFVFEARDIYLAIHKLDFQLRVSRSRPYDHEVEIRVEATLQWDGTKWIVEDAIGTDVNGEPADLTSDEKQIEEAVRERADKEPAP